MLKPCHEVKGQIKVQHEFGCVRIMSYLCRLLAKVSLIDIVTLFKIKPLA